MSDADWSILDIPGVMDMVRGVAAVVAREWDPLLELGDLEQEAYLRLATKSTEMREAIEMDNGGFRLLYHRLWCDLTDYAKRQYGRTELNFSYESLSDRGDE